MKRIDLVRVFVFAIMMLVFMTSVAFAADTVVSGGPVSDVLSGFIQIAATALGTLLLGLVTLGMHYLQKKWKLQVPDTWLASTNQWIDKSVSYAEEWAKNKVKSNETINGNDKLNTALRFLMTMVDDKKLIALGEDKVKLLIEARLNEKRAWGEVPTALISSVEKTVTPESVVTEAMTAVLNKETDK